MNVTDIVIEALDNARENGYYQDLDNLNYNDIAEDLTRCHYLLEECEIAELLPNVETYFNILKLQQGA